MRIAILIHYFFPPIHSGAISRNYYFSLEFAKRFDRIFVITTSNRRVLAGETKPLPSNMEVIEAATFDYRTVVGRHSKITHLPEGRKKGSLFRMLVKLQKTLPFHFLLGEGGLLYIYSALRAGSRILQKHDVSLIYSSFGPYADHLIACILKKKHKDLRWVADFRDLLVEPLYQNVYFEDLQKRWEQRLLRHADLVTTISEGLKKHLVRYKRPVLNVPRGVSLRNFNGNHFEKFTICYTGSLYRDFRDGDYFFFVLAKLIEDGLIDAGNIQFYYAGRDGSQFVKWLDRYNLRDIYWDHGFISQKETFEIQNRSHLQLLLTSATEKWGGVLTGKVFEYLEAGNPIVVLIKGDKDREFEDFIFNTGGGIVCYDPPQNDYLLKEFLLNQFKEWEKTGKPASICNTRYIESELSWSGQAAKILEGVELD
ncbi:MAG: hypothetical protein KDC80_15140 [Saprospiraceae bacterium]|nr:hypothetical protein [Saprospiraceae bacterium]